MKIQGATVLGGATYFMDLEGTMVIPKRKIHKSCIIKRSMDSSRSHHKDKIKRSTEWYRAYIRLETCSNSQCSLETVITRVRAILAVFSIERFSEVLE